MNYQQLPHIDILRRISKRFEGIRADRTEERPIPETLSSTQSKTLVFIDSGVADKQTLLDALGPNTEAIAIEGDRDGIDQIIEAIEGRTGIESIHILSHGSSGKVQLGTTELDADTLDAYLPQWQKLRAALQEGADILLYGCNVGASDTGIAFLQKLAEVTGADIAASDDLTGSAELQGNWTLEVSQGNIETPLPFQSEAIANYNSLLATTYTVEAGNVEQLIKAINDANGDGQDSIINLNSGTYNLTSVNNNIIGANGLPVIGANSTLIINGNGAEIVRDPAAQDAFRIFHVDLGANLTLDNLTVKNGLANSTAENNGRDGGGIYNRGILTVTQSTITENRADDDGGGINNDGTLTVIDSTISKNSANDAGGGIRHTNGENLIIIGSTLNENEAGNHGGGIENNGGTAIVTNSTISNNRAAIDGGGIYSQQLLTIHHSTIAFNTADSDMNGTGNGGGLFTDGTNVTLSHTIVAGNQDNSPQMVQGDVSGQITNAEYNLIGNLTGSQGLNTETNYNFASLGNIDINDVINPTLALNGASVGSPLTHALVLGSPATNLGSPELNSGLQTDQRGLGFRREVGTAIDIGAYEEQALPVITEIMYSPASLEPDWEWVEIYNPSQDITLDLTGFVFANANAALTGVNITTGAVAPGETAILYNATLSPESFKAVWDTGDIPLIPVSDWPALDNQSDRIGLWPSFSSYELGFQTAIDQVAYDIGNQWPSNSPGASIYLNNLTLEDLTTANDQGINWATSVIGSPNSTGAIATAYESTFERDNSGLDIGSPGPTDSILPNFQDFVAEDVTTAGGISYSFTVTFTDNRAIDWSTLDIGDIIVTGPNGQSLNVTAIAPNIGGNFNTIPVTYQIEPPGGTWDSEDNGSYTVNLQGNQVTDTTGNAIAPSTLGSFGVSLNSPPTLQPINQTGTKNTPFFFTPEYFTNQFLDQEGDTLQKILITSLPPNGSLFLDGNLLESPGEISLENIGKLSFVPDENFNGPVSFNWNGFDGTSYAQTPSVVNLNINAPPVLINPIENQTTTPGTDFTFQIPPNTFDDADIKFNDNLTYTVTLPNGQPLPSWLTFNPDGTFTGTPGVTDIGTIPIIITATDTTGATITDTFDLIIQPEGDTNPGGGGTNPDPGGIPGGEPVGGGTNPDPGGVPGGEPDGEGTNPDPGGTPGGEPVGGGTNPDPGGIPGGEPDGEGTNPDPGGIPGGEPDGEGTNPDPDPSTDPDGGNTPLPPNPSNNGVVPIITPNTPQEVPRTSDSDPCTPIPSEPPHSGCQCPIPPPPDIIFYGPQDSPPVEIFHFGTLENDVIIGDDRPEGILGFAGNDFLWGKGGNDVLYGDTGDDYILGGVGSDRPVGPGTDRDRIEGGKGNDFINGNEGNDTLYGGRENDLIYGGKDDDLIFGNLDNDILYGDLGNDTILGGNGSETPIGTEGDRDLIFGNRGNDIINGNEGDDIIYAGKDDDIAYGGKDNDLIYGDLGNDILIGDQGDDTLFGGTSDPDVPDIGGRDLIYGGDGNDLINGNQGDDTLEGGEGNDIIYGGKDNDIVCGSSGDDLLFGDLGDDTLYGEDGNDTIRGGIGSDAPLGPDSDRDFICGGDGDDWLEGNEGNDTLIGGNGKDTLYGGKDDDLLYGSDGDDFLCGDLGNDTLTGGAGRDRFMLRAGYGTDTISDFTPGEDWFVLAEGLTFDLLNFYSSNCGTAIAVGDEILAIAKGIEPETMVAEYFLPLT